MSDLLVKRPGMSPILWGREGSIGEVAIVRRRWGTGSPSTKNAASANNSTNLDTENAASSGDNAGGGGGGVETSVSNRVYPSLFVPLTYLRAHE